MVSKIINLCSWSLPPPPLNFQNLFNSNLVVGCNFWAEALFFDLLRSLMHLRVTKFLCSFTSFPQVSRSHLVACFKDLIIYGLCVQGKTAGDFEARKGRRGRTGSFDSRDSFLNLSGAFGRSRGREHVREHPAHKKPTRQILWVHAHEYVGYTSLSSLGKLQNSHRTPVQYKQPPEGPSTEDLSAQESHPDHARVFHDWSNHQDQAL